MDSRLLINIFINDDGHLQVVDKTPYEQWIHDGIFDADHQVLERVTTDVQKQIAWSNTTGKTPQDLRHSMVYPVKGNGLYHYKKLVIPTLEHSTAHINEFLYYNEGAVYFRDVDSGIEKTWLDPADKFDEIFECVLKYKPNNVFHFNEDSFSIYNLVSCYIEIEKKRIQNYLKNNCSNCNEDIGLDKRADILLSAIMVLRFLMENGEYFEAQRILNGLMVCGDICANITYEINDCNCGNT